MAQFGWPPKHLPNFKAALRDIKSKNAQFRRNAAISLGRAGEDQREEAVKAIEVLLDDQDDAVRLDALVSAIKLKPESLTDRIVKFLDSQLPDERAAALDFLLRAGKEHHWERVKTLLLNEKETDVKCMALETLSYINPDECRRLVLEALRDTDDIETGYLRTLIHVLSEIGELEDLNILSQFLEHPSIGVRLETAHILAMMNWADDRERMAVILMDAAVLVRDRRLKELALEGLCRLGGDRILETARVKFRKFFMSKQEKIYWAAICCREGDPRAKGYLKRIYNGRNIPAAAKVLWAVGLCGIKEWIPMMEENLRKYLARNEGYFLYDSISSLGKMNCEESVEILRRFRKEFKGQKDIAEFIEGELELSERLLQAKT